MRPTLEFVKRKFEEFNSACFAGRLPPLPLSLGTARNYCGRFVFPKVRGADVQGCSIRISARFDLPEEELENTIIHEMIHYFIWYMNLKDDSPHGRIFRRIMEDINKRLGRDITVRHRLTEEQIQSDEKRGAHYICLTIFQDGQRGLTCCQPGKILEIQKAFRNCRDIKTMEWYFSTSPWFNKFPKARTPKIYYISEADFASAFKGATPCVIRGNYFIPAGEN